MQHSYDVVEVVAMRLIGSDETVVPVNVELSFRTSDPYTIRAVFRWALAMSTWVLGRELLTHGLLAGADDPAGTGDVQVWRDNDPQFVLVALSGVEDSALLAAPAYTLEAFLARTETLVPVGQESALMDDAIAALIATLLTT